MKFGIREVCDIIFTKEAGVGPTSFEIKSAKMTTLEEAATTVYAQGGKGNSRLMAWEGDKTLTFTVEDALITMESFWALTGATMNDTTDGVKFTTYPTSFAGYYRITADTLFRDENGIDHAAEIIIPRAKLQTNLSLSMAPTGDPSTFTFTFDAMPSNKAEEQNMLFSLEIKDEADAVITAPVGDNPNNPYTSIFINNVYYRIDGTSPKVTVATPVNTNPAVITFTATGSTKTATVEETLKTDEILTDLIDYVEYGESKVFSLIQGTTTRFYIIN